MADAEEKGPSKRALEKERKKAEAKAKKEAAKAGAPSTAAAAKPTASEPTDPFKRGWLRETYNEKPVSPHEVHTRFPPEPNGYLHIGHAKAITVNFGFAKSYGGVCNLRYDDTNPSKEEAIYFEKILEMVQWLGFEPYKITHSSDEFDKLYELAEKLIEKDGAYVCLCSKEEVQRRKGKLPGGEHGPRVPCEHWGWSADKNLHEFRKMRDGAYKPREAHLRMKQFLATKPDEYEVLEADSAEVRKEKAKLKAWADNPALWDVAAYRIPENGYHHRTHDKWRIYPTYEFTHCICDALEGITHSLCTVEFETLRPAYNWLLEKLEIKDPGSDGKGPMQREYGRLSVEGTILSKRRIMMLVSGTTVTSAADTGKVTEDLEDGIDELTLAEEGDEEPVPRSQITQSSTASINGSSSRTLPSVVKGWDDPRLFTLVALRRRGIPPGALKKFVLDLGVTKSNANTATHALDATIRTYLERTVPRLMLVLDPIKITLTNLPEDYLEERDVPFDPKDESKGTHKLPFTRTLYIDRDDFREIDDPDFFRLSPNQSVGLLHAEHPIRCLSFSKNQQTGKVESIEAEYGANVPKAKSRIHWIGLSEKHGSPVKAEARIFNSLFKTNKPNELDWKGGGYFDDINPENLVVYENAMIECGFAYVRKNAPWPKEEGEAKQTSGMGEKSGVRFQGLRTAFFCEDTESTAEKVVVNRIVSLREDGAKK